MALERDELVKVLMSMVPPGVRYNWQDVKTCIALPIVKAEWETWVKNNPQKT